MGLLTITPVQRAGLAWKEKKDELKAVAKQLMDADGNGSEELKTKFANLETEVEQLAVRYKSLEKYSNVVDEKDETELKALDNKFRSESDSGNDERASYGSAKSFSEYKGRSSEEQAYRFMNYILADVLSSPKSPLANTAMVKNAQKFCKNHIKAMGENTNTAGGSLVPIEFVTQLIKLREQYGALRRLVRVTPMTSDAVKVPRRTAGVTAYYVGEGATITESDISYDQVQLIAKKLAALTQFSTELGEDAFINVADQIMDEIAYGFSKAEDQAGFLGDGTSTYGHIIGLSQAFLGLGGTIANIAGLTVATGTGYGTNYNSAVLTDFEAVAGKLPLYADTPNACWVASRGFYYNVMVKLMMAQGGVTATETADGRRIPMFLGYPVKFAQVMPSISAVSQICCYFGDFNKAMLFGERRGVDLAFSDQVYFTTDQLAIRGTERYDINVHDVGNYNSTASLQVPGPVVGLITAAS